MATQKDFRVKNGIIVGDSADISNDLTVNSNTLYVDSANNRVGVGTSSPDTTLDVAGPIKTTGNPANLILQSTGATVNASRTDVPMFNNNFEIQSRDSSGNYISSDYVIEKGDNGAVRHDWKINGSEAMRIDSSGNVGIGTSSPAEKLEIDGGNVRLADNSVVFNNATLDIRANNPRHTTSHALELTARGPNDRIAFKTDAAERMRIAPSGNVGIGTSSPSQRLHVNGSGLFNFNLNLQEPNPGDTGSPDLVFIDGDGNENGRIWADNADLNLRSRNGPLTFRPNDIEHMRINSSGNVGIGTSSPNAKLEVIGQAKITNHFFVATDKQSPSFVGSDGICLFRDGRVDSAASTTTAGAFGRNGDGTGNIIVFRSNGSNVGLITTNGSSTSYNTSSDYRLKENVTELSDGIERLKHLPVHRFNFIADPDTTVDGFIAHEVQPYVPEAVTGEKDAVDEDGNPEYQGIDQAKLVPLLTASLQEAIERIETLEAQVASLTNNSAQ